MKISFQTLLFPALAAGSLALVSPTAAVLRDGGIDPANLGKGDWIYAVQDATNRLFGHVNSVTNETSLMLFYRNQGIRYVIVKAGTGASLYNACYAFPQLTTNFINAAHANGILVFGYNRSYATNVAGEIAIANFVFNQGADGFVWDAEAEWESTYVGSQGPSLAWQQCSQVRSNWPNKFLAHAPFPIIALHASFPYREFGYWCDAVMPQIYHFSSSGIKGSPSAAINWSDVNWAAWQNGLLSLPPTNINGLAVYWTNAIKPIVPLQDVYGAVIPVPGNCNTLPPPYPDEDVMEFIDYASADPHAQTAGGYKGINFWRTDTHGAAQWSNIKNGTSGDFPGAVNNIVMDDPKAASVGNWTGVQVFGATASTPNYYGATGTDTNCFGTNYLYKSHGAGAAYVQFTPTIATPGDYEVYEWHPYRVDASAAVPFVVNYNGGSTTVNMNQKTNAGNWSFVGRFSFAAGTAGNIRVLDNFAEPSAVALADGLKLVYVSPMTPPAMPTSLAALAVDSSRIILSWANDPSNNESAFVVSRGTNSGGPYPDIAALNANVTGFTNSGLAPATAYYYVVRATNSLGASADSSQATATTPVGPPIIIKPPMNQSVIAGQNALFTVAAGGDPPLAYQWRFNGADIAGATQSTYTLVNAQTNHAGGYSVLVTNTAGATTTSPPATLTVNFSLNTTATSGGSVAASPNQFGYAPGTVVSLTAIPLANGVFLGWSGDAIGSSNPLVITMTTNKSITADFLLTYFDLIVDDNDATTVGSWTASSASPGYYGSGYRFKGPGTGDSYVDFRPTIPAAGNYDVYAWYVAGGNRTSNARHIINSTVGAQTVGLNQEINGSQWVSLGRFDFAVGTSGYVRVSDVMPEPSGNVVMADAIRFTQASPPGIFTQPAPLTVNAGDPATFFVQATGTPPLSYRWRLNNVPLAGANESVLTHLAVGANDAGDYSVVVTNPVGTIISSNALLTVVPPVALRFQRIAVLADRRTQLTLGGPTGVTYAVDTSSNLTGWSPLLNLQLNTSPSTFLDETASNAGTRFYRARH